MFFRSLGHIILGITAVIAGAVATNILSIYANLLHVLAGLFVVFTGWVVIAGILEQKNCRYGKKSDYGAALLGFISGITPCVALLGAMAYIAFRTESIMGGILNAVSFGAGTFFSPVILFAAAASHAPASLLSSRMCRIFRVICGLFLAVLGMILIGRGM